MSPPWGTVEISVEHPHTNSPGLWKNSVLCRFYAVFSEVPPQKSAKNEDFADDGCQNGGKALMGSS
jgi:hypothetical protein